MPDTFDYRDILKTLNSIGYSNISAAELKAFKKGLFSDRRPYDHFISNKIHFFPPDLNALIKYESGNSSKANENLHSVRKNKENEGIGRAEILVNPNQMENCSHNQNRHQTPTRSKKTVDRGTQLDEKKDKVKDGEHTETERPISTEKNPSTTKQRHGRAKSKFPTKRVLVKNTPVDLYQMYKRDWEKFKKFIPGENTREEVRKEVRARVQKQPPAKPTVSFFLLLNGMQMHLH